MNAKIQALSLMFIIFGMLPFSALGAFKINFDGTLVVTPPECTINGGIAVDVEFGDVHETLINNSSYKRMPIEYALNCTQIYSNALKMTLTWNGITLNGQNVVHTNRNNLGIAIYKDNTRLSSGSVINFTYGGALPALYAVPVKPVGMTLTDGGEFYGVLTMVIDYR